MTTKNPNSFWQLPPIPQPPHDPTWWLLNGQAGWHSAKLDGVVLTAGTLGLLTIDGSGRLLNEPSGSFGGLLPPGNAALAEDGSLYLLDPNSGELERFDSCSCQFQIVPCLGGIGAAPRQVRNPHGIGICSGNLFVCDTDNHRLLLFGLRGFVLRAIWAPPASAGLAYPWQPYGIAFDHRGRVYVSDPANSCVHCFHPTGMWLHSLPGFANVRWITLDCCNRLYAVLQGEAAVRITDTKGKLLGAASRPDEVSTCFGRLAFTVDAYGNMDLSIMCTTPASSTVFDPTGAPVPAPPKNPPLLFQTSGSYWSEALDSQFYRCQWHRVVLQGEVPPKTAIYVSTYSSEVLQTFDQIQALPDDAWQTNLLVTEMHPEWEGLIFSGPGRYLWLRLRLSGNGTATPNLHSVRVEYPRISLRRYLPGVFAEDPGGADFADRFLSIFDTTLRGMEQKIDNEAAYFDPLSAPAVPAKRPGTDFLSWLASWIGVSLDRQSPVEQRRQLLKQAGKLHPIRGTRIGLWRQLLLFLGMQPEMVCCPDDQPKKSCVAKPANCAPKMKQPCVWEPPALILEHYQLRRWMFLGTGCLGDDAVLWGKRIVNRSQLSSNAQVGVSQLITTPDPYHDPFGVYSHKFTVFVPAAYSASDQKRRALINLLESEKPAHTQYQVEYVAPRLRIGFQSMIGLDSVVGRYPIGFKLGDTLGKTSVLSGLPARPGGLAFEIGQSSRIGSTTKLD